MPCSAGPLRPRSGRRRGTGRRRRRTVRKLPLPESTAPPRLPRQPPAASWLLPFELLDGPRLLRQRRRQLFELLIVLIGRHARLAQAEPGNLFLETALFLERRPQRRIRDV